MPASGTPCTAVRHYGQSPEAPTTEHKHGHKPPAGQTQAVPMSDLPHLSVLQSSLCILRQILAFPSKALNELLLVDKVLKVRDTVRKLMTELVVLVLRAGFRCRYRE